jgi:glycosyltransferase involved in cell wall biosynthesis
LIIKRKIVFIIVSLKAGGAQSMLLRLLKHLDKERYDATVVVLTDSGDLGRSIIDLGIPLVSIGMKKNPLNIFALFRLYKVILEIYPDVIHTWMYHSDLIGGLIAKLIGTRRIIWGIRSADFFSSDTSLSTKLIVKACARVSNLVPDVILYNSRRGLEFHNKLGYASRKSQVIYNGVDMDRFKPKDNAQKELRLKLNVKCDTKIVGLVARYDYLKNHKGFIEMASYINDVSKDCHYLMIGDNIVNNGIIISLLQDHNLTEKFHLLDSTSDIENIIAGLDVTVITSLSEAFPNVFIESMACGVPCFSTDVGDVRDIAYDTDWVVPIGAMHKLAGLCSHYLSFDEKKKKIIKNDISEYTNKHFNSISSVRNYETVYTIKN